MIPQPAAATTASQKLRQQKQRGLLLSTVVVISVVALTANVLISQTHIEQLRSGRQSQIGKALRRFQEESLLFVSSATTTTSTGSSSSTDRTLHEGEHRKQKSESSKSQQDTYENNPFLQGSQNLQNRIQHTDILETETEAPFNETLAYPTEDPIPNPVPASGYDTFSACLLVMDDNPRLLEWLAYHYHVLPLRYLVVAVDPRSRTSPTFILNRFRKMGVYIEQWTDADFLDPKLASNVIQDDARFQVKRDRHRARQKVFYRSCLIKMQDANRTYVTLHDTDEYLVYNHAGGEQYETWEKQQQEKHDQSRNKGKTRIKPFHTPPTTAEEGSMLSYIRREKEAGHPFYQSPCISCPRLHFGAVESNEKERYAQVPAGFDAERFDTMRWRKHSKRNDFIKNNLAKIIIDVSNYDMKTAPRFRSLHRPIPTICQAPWLNEWESSLRINHYLGSWESYSFRNDARKGEF